MLSESSGIKIFIGYFSLHAKMSILQPACNVALLVGTVSRNPSFLP